MYLCRYAQNDWPLLHNSMKCRMCSSRGLSNLQQNQQNVHSEFAQLELPPNTVYFEAFIGKGGGGGGCGGPSSCSKYAPDSTRICSWFFAARLHLDSADLKEDEIDSKVFTNIINKFSDYQKTHLKSLKIFSFSFNPNPNRWNMCRKRYSV